MNAIQLLKEDHKKVSHLFGKVKATNEVSEMQDIFERIKEELEMHTHIEETIFYPKLREEEELKDIVLEGIEEHRQAKMLLGELEEMNGSTETFKARIKVMMEDVEHHVQEEEGEMFKMVEEQFEPSTLEELGKEMAAEKAKAMKSKTAGSGK